MITIDGTPIDIATSVTYSGDSEATAFPVEEGADITDHVRLGQLKIELECVVSDTPIGAIAADPSRGGGGGLSSAVAGVIGVAPTSNGVPSLAYGQTTFDRLVQIRDARKPVVVSTPRGDFENMILSFSVPDDISTSGGLVFTASLVQIKVAENERVTIAVAAEPRGKGKQNRGALTLDPIVIGEWRTPVSWALPTIVFTIKVGQKETKYWEQNPNKVHVATTAAGVHYKADIWTYADGIVNEDGTYTPVSRKTFASAPAFIRHSASFDRGAAGPEVTRDRWNKAYGQRVGAGGAPVNGPLRGNRF